MARRGGGGGGLLACLGLGYGGYLLLGALVISAVERPHERRLRAELRELKAVLLARSPCLSEAALERFLAALLSAQRRGVALPPPPPNASAPGPASPASPASNWDFASAFFFCSTLITTVGYGYTTPLSDAGKAFCICYALLGVPFTMLLLTASVQRLIGTLTSGPLESLALKWGYTRRTLSCGHLLLLSVLVLVFFFLVPAAIFSALEDSWSYLDAFYFCFISLCTIGLGDYVPGEKPGQRFRPLYKISVTVYLLLGLLAMLLLLQTFHKAAELHGLSDLVLPPREPPHEDHECILGAREPPSEPAESVPVQPPLSAGGQQPNYASISR